VYFPETGKVIKHKVVKFAMPAQSASEQKLTSHDDSTFVLHRNSSHNNNKKAVLPQGNRAMPHVFFSVEVCQQHSLQV